MQLLTDSFQRKLILQHFKNWFSTTIAAFMPPINIQDQINTSSDIDETENIENNN